MSRIEKIKDEDVYGLVNGIPDSLNRVMSLAHKIAGFEVSKKKLSSEDIQDLIQTSIVELIEEIRQNKYDSGGELDRGIKRAVWKVAQRIRRYHERQNRLSENIDKFSEILVSPSIEAEYRDLASGKQIYKAEKSKKQDSISKSDLIITDDELIRYFQKHPKQLYNISPRKFEELVAAILNNLGYSVELTSKGADGGVDIFATQKSSVGELLLIVDCKRFSPCKRVGVGIVRSLFGLGERRWSPKTGQCDKL